MLATQYSLLLILVWFGEGVYGLKDAWGREVAVAAVETLARARRSHERNIDNMRVTGASFKPA